jgi:hypothetical protein
MFIYTYIIPILLIIRASLKKEEASYSTWGDERLPLSVLQREINPLDREHENQGFGENEKTLTCKTHVKVPVQVKT